MTTGEFIIEKFYLYFQGMMLFQVIFFGILYFLNRRKEVLYYCLLNLSTSCYFFLNAPDTFFDQDPEVVFNNVYYPYVNFAFLLVLNLLYGLFLRILFKDTFKTKVVYVLFKLTVAMIVILYFIFLVYKFLNYSTQTIFYLAHLINGLFCLPILIYNLKTKGKLKLIVYSMFITFICVTITLIMTIRYNTGHEAYYIDKYPLLYVRIGMFIDIILYQLFLMQNWNEQEKQLVTKDLQSQLEVERLRNDISNDLHDDIGSSLTKLNLKSFMLSKEIKDENQNQKIESIRIEIAAISQNLKDIVWSINADRKGFDLPARIRELINDLRESTNIKIEFIDDSYENSISNLKYNHNLYLIIKEAVNNAIKYSECNKIKIVLSSNKLCIEDNGKGFNITEELSGNGLKNMKMRSEAIGGDFEIISKVDGGTRVGTSL